VLQDRNNANFYKKQQGSTTNLTFLVINQLILASLISYFGKILAM